LVGREQSLPPLRRVGWILLTLPRVITIKRRLFDGLLVRDADPLLARLLKDNLHRSTRRLVGIGRIGSDQSPDVMNGLYPFESGLLTEKRPSFGQDRQFSVSGNNPNKGKKRKKHGAKA